MVYSTYFLSPLYLQITRMKTIQNTGLALDVNQNGVRFIGLSATVPNADDVAEWFGDPKKSAKSFRLDVIF